MESDGDEVEDEDEFGGDVEESIGRTAMVMRMLVKIRLRFVVGMMIRRTRMMMLLLMMM